MTGTAGDAAHVVFTSPRSDLEDHLAIRFETGPSSVRVSAKNRRHGWFEHWNGRVRVQVEVPFQTALEIHTAGGSIDVRGLQGVGPASDVRRRPRGGGPGRRPRRGDLRRIDRSSEHPGFEPRADLRRRNSGGPYRRTSRRRNKRRVRRDPDDQRRPPRSQLRGSDPDHRGGRKDDADTSGGGIHASFARGNSKGGRLESSGGGITVSVDPAANLSIDAEGDSVDTDLPLQIHGSASHGSLHGRLNGGGSPLRLETSGGSVRIRAL